jgi:hypothetical protein
LTLASIGTIENGTIVDAGSGIAFAGGTLSGVTYDGTMNLSTANAYVYLTNGLTLGGANGTGSGTINLTGQSADIYAEGGESLNNATLNIGNSNNYDYLYNYDPYGLAVLTLGANLTINQVGTYTELYTSYYGRTGSGIVNAGTINAGLSGGTFTIQGSGSFTNQGTINVSNGDTLNIGAAIFLNAGALIANGGNINVTAAETAGSFATIYGTSQIEYSAASYDNITFAQGSTGELLLLSSASFHGNITGFTGSGTGAPATSDKLDLRDINFASAQFATSFANNVLTVTDSTHTAKITFVGSYTLANFHFASDGSGGTLITDPPTPSDQPGAPDTTYAVSAVMAGSGEAHTSQHGALESSNASDTVTVSEPVAAGAISGSNAPAIHKATLVSASTTLVLEQPPNVQKSIAEMSVSSDGQHSKVLGHIDEFAATAPGSSSSGTNGSVDALHQDFARPFLSMDQNASFRFNDLTTQQTSGDSQFGKAFSDSTVMIDPPTARIVGDHFVFEASLGSSNHETIDGLGHGQPKTNLDGAASIANDISKYAVDTENDALYPNQALTQSNHNSVVHLHANEFILPTH